MYMSSIALMPDLMPVLRISGIKGGIIVREEASHSVAYFLC